MDHCRQDTVLTQICSKLSCSFFIFYLLCAQFVVMMIQLQKNGHLDKSSGQKDIPVKQCNPSIC